MKMKFNLKSLRVNKGLTQKEVAKILNVSPLTIHNWETGKHKISAVMLNKLSVLYGITIENIQL